MQDITIEIKGPQGAQKPLIAGFLYHILSISDFNVSVPENCELFSLKQIKADYDASADLSFRIVINDTLPN